MDVSMMNRPDTGMPDIGEFCAVCTTLHDAAEILHMADRIPDEGTKAPLIDGAKRMLQNVQDALDGRRTEGLVIPEEDDE